jgi:beta-barrel assembly-enhancing protease
MNAPSHKRYPLLSNALLLSCLVFVDATICLGGQASTRNTPTRQPGSAGFNPMQFVPADFDAFFERLFGTGSKEDREKLESIDVSIAEERKLGKQMVDAYLQRMKAKGVYPLTSGRDVKYLQGLAKVVKPLMKNGNRYSSIRIVVLKTREFEARSFPGGTLAFSQGLLDRVESEATVIAIVAHELSHLDRGHQLLPIRRMKLMKQMTRNHGLTFSPDAFMSTGPLLMRLWRPFRPEDEAAADQDAVKWTYQADYDPRALARMFQQFDEEQQDPAAPIPTMFRSHPPNRDRRNAAISEYTKLQRTMPKQELYVGVKNLQQRIPRSQQAFPE